MIMAAAITRGTTFTNGQQNVDVATFNPILTAATIANINRDNVNLVDYTPASMLLAAPDSPQASELWQDTVTHFIKVYKSGAWAPALSFGRVYTLSAVSGTSVVAGNVLSPSNAAADSGTQKMQISLATVPFKAWGVATESVALGGTGRMITHGVVKVVSSGTINAGEAVVCSSSTNGIVVSAGAAGVGYGPSVIGTALEAASGGYVWIHLRR